MHPLAALQVFVLLTLLITLGPVKIYFNFGKERAQVRKDHRGTPKSGIYCLINLYHFGCYIGQSSNLLVRFNSYLNPAYLMHLKNSGMPICQGLSSHGPQGFALVIIEYITVTLLDLREIFWIDLLQPYYNIQLGGNTTRGYKHTDDSKAKMSLAATGRGKSSVTRSLISATTIGVNNLSLVRCIQHLPY